MADDIVGRQFHRNQSRRVPGSRALARRIRPPHRCWSTPSYERRNERLVHDAHETGLAACVLLQIWKNHPDPSLANRALFFLFGCVDQDFVEERPAQRQSGARPKISIENVR